MSQLNNLSADEAPVDPSVGADPTYGGYEAPYDGYGSPVDTGYGGYASPPETGYAAGAARMLASGWSSIINRCYANCILLN